MPKAGPLLLYGVQWFIILLPCVIIMGIVVARLHYPDAAAHMWYMRKLLALMGGVTILQVLIGHRLPLVVGPATALLVALLASVAAGVEAIYTSICLGGLVLAFLAYSGCLSRIRFFFTPRIITVILMLIAFTLAPTILRLSFPDPEHPVFHLFFALIVVLALVLCNKVLPGIWKSMTIPCGIAGGCAAYFAVFGLPQLAEIGNAEGLNLFITAPVFDFGTILCFLFCFLALIINELGSIEALGHMLRVPDMDRRIKLGTGMQGLGNIAAGSLGVIGPVDFSMSAGIVAATGCASRYTLLPARSGTDRLCLHSPGGSHTQRNSQCRHGGSAALSHGIPAGERPLHADSGTMCHGFQFRNHRRPPSHDGSVHRLCSDLDLGAFACPAASNHRQRIHHGNSDRHCAGARHFQSTQEKCLFLKQENRKII